MPSQRLDLIQLVALRLGLLLFERRLCHPDGGRNRVSGCLEDICTWLAQLLLRAAGQLRSGINSRCRTQSTAIGIGINQAPQRCGYYCRFVRA